MNVQAFSAVMNGNYEPLVVPNTILIKVQPQTNLEYFKSLPFIESVTDLGNQHNNNSSSPLLHWKKVIVQNGTQEIAIDTLQKLPFITEVYPMRRFRVCNLPSADSLTYNQWGMYSTRVFQSWNVTAGRSNVLIGVIDTGTDLTHPDLAPILWINPGEDLNRDGRISPNEENGIDDDLNGFVDDFWGYDFTDTQGFPTGGDDTVPDNMPSDEMGHGTAVAGIAIAASNRIGIVGVAPHCRLMTLRAGNANGYLEEDDVAAALIYAAENGADVVNMSFGDVVVAPMLRDAIDYAYAHNVVLVASAGNTGQNTLHYPSGYNHVISVGASNQSNSRASFSSYGNTLALLAPGSNIYSTLMNGNWGTFQGGNGTSFSSPFVTGVVALLRSRDSTLSPSEIRTILCTSCDDIAETGWDLETGHGILNAERALLTPRQAVAAILSPTENQSFASDSCEVIGTVAGPRELRWTLSYGLGDNPNEWTPIVRNQSQQKVRERLGVFLLPSMDTTLTLRLTMQVIGGGYYETRVSIQRDRTPPNFIRLKCLPALVQGEFGWRFEIETNDKSQCKLSWFTHNDTLEFPFRYIHKLHAAAVTPSLGLMSGMNVQVVLTNLSGLTSTQSVVLPPLPNYGQWLPLQEITNWYLPSGHLLNKSFDWNRNNRPEILLNVYNESQDYDTLKLFEFVNGNFIPLVNYGKWIAQDCEDITGDSIPELMIRAYGVTIILTKNNEIPYPFTEIIPPDTTESYGAKIIDLDMGDRHSNFFLRRGNTYEAWRLYWNNVGTYTPERTFVFNNTTNGDNLLGRPRFRIGTMNTAGQKVGAFGDTDGNILVFRRNADNHWVLTFSDSLGVGDATDYLEFADATGDGISELVVGYHNASNLRTEHEAPLRKWVFYLYRLLGNRLVRTDSLIIDGAQDPKEFDAGIESGDIDGDGNAEFFISAYPYLLVLDINPTTYRWNIVYQARNCRSNSVALFDLDRNGRKELVYNDGHRFRFLEWMGFSQSPPIPIGIFAQPLDTNKVRIRWNRVPNATYKLIRAVNQSSFQSLVTLNDTTFIDSTVENQRRYRYAVAAIDSSLPIPISPYSIVVDAFPNEPPRLISAAYEPPNFIRVIFNEPLSSASLQPSYFQLDRRFFPISVLSSHQNQHVILRFDTLLYGNTSTLIVSNVVDTNFTPLKGNNQIQINIPPLQERSFFVQSARIEGQSIVVEFSESYNPNTITIHSFHSNPLIEFISLLLIDSTRIRLNVSGRTPIGVMGVVYELRADTTIRSMGGVPLDYEFSIKTIVTQPLELVHLTVYPNPVRFYENEKLTIAGTPRGTKITFYTLSGLPVRTIEADLFSGGAIWDGKNDAGNKVSSGIYYFRAVHQNQYIEGKVAVIQ
ncbi:MAG: S8 family serine peptidase [bacterium]|nr:S8 family serine peptidase [bacterium]